MLGQILGSLIGAGANLFMANKEKETQKEFAQKGIQWKVKDAVKAGVHPLFALGANTVSYSPSNVGSDLSSTLESMGAGIDRARSATSEAPVRGVIGKLALERAGLENDLLRAQIVSETRRSLPPHVGPAMPGLVPVDSVNPQQTTGLNIGGAVRTNPYFSDAQTIEDRYGDSEVLSMLSAIVNGGADAYWYGKRGPKGKGAYVPLNRGAPFRK